MLSKMKAGLRPCMMNYSSFKEMMFEPWYLDQKESTSLAQSGYSVIKLMKRKCDMQQALFGGLRLLSSGRSGF